MGFSESVLQEVLQKTDLVEIVGSYVSLKANGQRWWGLCPFHQEKSPSFTVNPGQGFFYCFGCQEKGNAFQFLMKIDHLTFPEAVKKLADKAGVLIEETLSDDPEDRDRRALLELFGRLSATFHHLLLTSKEATASRELLEKRKILPKTIVDFQLGYVPADRYWLKNFLLEKKFNSDFLVKTGLFSQKNPDSCLFSGRLIFPIRSAAGQIVAFGGRVVGENDGPKYLNSPETLVFQKRRTLFALDRAVPFLRTSSTVHLCEGYMDALALHQSGVETAVAPLGTAFTEDHARLLQRYVRNVVCVFDSDEAGRKAAVRTVEICLPFDLDIQVVAVENGKDPAEILEKEGEEAVRNLTLQSQRGFDFLLNFYYNSMNHESAFDWKGFSRVMFPLLMKVSSQVRQETLLKVVSERLGVSEAALLKDFRSGTPHQPTRPTAPPSEKSSKSEEWIFLLTATSHSSAFRKLRSELNQEDLRESRSKELFEILAELNDKHKDSFFSVDEVLEVCKGRPWETDLIQGLASGESEMQHELVLKDGLARLKLRKLEGRLAEVQRQMETTSPALETSQSLLAEVKFLSHEIEIARWKGKV